MMPFYEELLGADSATIPFFKELPFKVFRTVYSPDGWDEMSAVTGRVFVAVDFNAEAQSRREFECQLVVYSALVADKAATSGQNSTFSIFHPPFACAPTNRNPYTIAYAYDHRGRMVRKDVFCSGNSPFSILHYTFVWDGWNIIRETQWPVTSGQWPVVTDNIWVSTSTAPCRARAASAAFWP